MSAPASYRILSSGTYRAAREAFANFAFTSQHPKLWRTLMERVASTDRDAPDPVAMIVVEPQKAMLLVQFIVRCWPGSAGWPASRSPYRRDGKFWSSIQFRSPNPAAVEFELRKVNLQRPSKNVPGYDQNPMTAEHSSH
jgi:hypothetical protein